MTDSTVGNWERGEARPQEASQEDILDAIPSELTLEEVQDATGRFDDDGESGAFAKEKRLFGSEWLQALREKPLVDAELGGGQGMSVFTPKQRMIVEQLGLSEVKGGIERAGDSVTTVYYLEGDERRAVRRFIEANEAIVRQQLQNAPNRLSHEWDKWLYGLLKEEFRFRLYE